MSKAQNFTPALGHNWLTQFYDRIVSVTMPETAFREKLVDELDPRDQETLLEFGYGTAQNISFVYQRNHHITLHGLDIDPAVRAIAVKKMEEQGIRVQLDLYEGKTFPYADQSFDKVFSALVFHHLDRESKIACLKEIHRTLKPGGQLIIGDWGKPTSIGMRILFYIVQFIDGFRTTTDNVNGLLPAFMRQAGFKNVTERGVINTMYGTCCYYRANK
ncbi:class I SAM-dependent methyltransferase [Chitinophaga nivalis]|uniref:Class I SAM-dependent methyltransferase n=1 Tax=Chitinophaga nivalis TaxID=2991709 RepID=A0ABT3IMB8_9BACT|nr:class I SAM-dependent methyltransferase [Chitinophaga nivalis]MCW3465196.1 class I SAM-dependent methyltransferase [Chitinophaga nivalis]MCW3485112.1 class I SAM-dependent methyltransferase [Chitinophaga nivalis]